MTVLESPWRFSHAGAQIQPGPETIHDVELSRPRMLPANPSVIRVNCSSTGVYALTLTVLYQQSFACATQMKTSCYLRGFFTLNFTLKGGDHMEVQFCHPLLSHPILLWNSKKRS